MPVRQLILLVALFVACLGIAGIAWATDAELYFYLPARGSSLFFPQRFEPTHPGLVLGLLAASLPVAYLSPMGGLYYFFAITAGILLGIIRGAYAFGWTQSWAQCLLAVAMIATSIYAWKQKYYFEE